MNDTSKVKYFQGKLDGNTIYIFIDESGSLHDRNFQQIQEDIKKEGLVKNNNKNYTLTALIVYSIKKYKFIKKEMNEIKKRFFPDKNIKELVLHRTDLRTRKFLEDNNMSLEDTYLLEKEINSLIIRHKLPTFSVSLNNEVLFNNPKYKFNSKINLKEQVLIKLLKSIQRNIKKDNPKQKIILIIETTNNKDDKKVVELINELIENKTLWTFKKVLITNKVNKKKESILGDELVDFIGYSYFLWASNSLFHNSKFLLYGYPNHYKNSLSIIDSFIVKTEK